MFNFNSLQHFAASTFQNAVHVAKAIIPVLEKVQKSENTVEALTGLVDPQFVVMERAAYSLLGNVVVAVGDGKAAIAAGGVNIQLDTSSIEDLKTLYSSIVSKAAINGVVIGKTG